MTPPRYFLLRLVRNGPLVPGRLQVIDHEPGEPDNKREGSRWPVLLEMADIAGEEVPPEDLTERLWAPATHWKYAQPVSEAEYRRHFARLRWAERHRPTDPTLRPRRAVDVRQVPLPSFERENA